MRILELLEHSRRKHIRWQFACQRNSILPQNDLAAISSVNHPNLSAWQCDEITLAKMVVAQPTRPSSFLISRDSAERGTCRRQTMVILVHCQNIARSAIHQKYLRFCIRIIVNQARRGGLSPEAVQTEHVRQETRAIHQIALVPVLPGAIMSEVYDSHIRAQAGRAITYFRLNRRITPARMSAPTRMRMSCLSFSR